MVPSACRTHLYNTVLSDPTVRIAIRYLAIMDPCFNSESFINRISVIPSFPSIAVGELIAAAKAAGVSLRGAHATLDEMKGSGPFLAYLKRQSGSAFTTDLVRIEKVRRRAAVIAHDRFGKETMPWEQLAERWSGIVLLTDQRNNENCSSSELEAYRKQVSLITEFLMPDECAELIDYCEQACFRRSRVVERRGSVMTDVVSIRTRSSSSVVLEDRSHPLLARIYRLCSEMEGVAESDIESIQCVRYKRGQQFRAHFDSGVDLPRLTTFLLYLNDGFTGGETYFPMLDMSVSPATGTCLRFPSCLPDRRILWPSEHGGLPVGKGVKYALNIWVRCKEEWRQ